MFGKTKKMRVGVVRLEGAIGRDLNLKNVKNQIDNAFVKSRCVVLLINSPGGAAGQSSVIFNYIRTKAVNYGVPVLSFIEDMGASGGYWIALAGDAIFANENAIVGSIGVVGAGFGLQDLIARYGIERRVYTAGKNKMLNDMFRPETEEGREKIAKIQLAIHNNFIALVKNRRGSRLKGEDDVLFNGDVWVGSEAQDNGLIDAMYYDIETAVEAMFKDQVSVRLTYFEKRKGFLDKFGWMFGKSMVHHGMSMLENMDLNARVKG